MNRKLFLVALMVLFTTITTYAQEESEEEVTQLPDVTLASTDGENVNVSSYGVNGKITIISFWATWCAPCKRELNNLADLYEDWQDDYNVEIVAVSTDDARTSAKVKPYVDGQAWEYEVLLDVNEDLKRALNFQTVPFTLVVDQEGDIIYEHTGYKEGDEYELEDLLIELNEEE